MTKAQRQSYAARVMAVMVPLMPNWSQRQGKFRHFQSELRCKELARDVLVFAKVSVCPPRGMGTDTLSLGVGWTDELGYDESIAIQFERPSALLQDLIGKKDAPEWSRVKCYVGLEHLKRRGGVFSGLNVGLGIEPEEVGELVSPDMEKFGLRFLAEFASQRGLNL